MMCTTGDVVSTDPSSTTGPCLAPWQGLHVALLLPAGVQLPEENTAVAPVALCRAVSSTHWQDFCLLQRGLDGRVSSVNPRNPTVDDFRSDVRSLAWVIRC